MGNSRISVSLLRIVIKTIFWINKIFNKSIINAAVKLNASNAMIIQLKSIIENKDEDGFFIDVRVWLRTHEKNKNK